MKTFALKCGYAWINASWLQKAILTIRDDLIVNVSTDLPSNIPVQDASDALVLPGFVNAHCHLELTALGPIAEQAFMPWIAQLMAKKKTLSSDDIATGITIGAKRLLNSGVTTVIDHVSPETNPASFSHSPLKHIGFGEVLSVNLEMAHATLRHWENQKQFAITPHSIHAVAPQVLKSIFSRSHAHYSMHLAESEIEQTYFSEHSGPMWDFIQARGETCHTGSSAIDWLKLEGLSAPASLLVHGNYFSDDDLITISQWPNICIVHCPGSHAFFGHHDLPYEKIIAKKIPLALGTDSLASNSDLSLVHELRLFCKKYPGQTLENIIPMLTTNALVAIGITDRGQLAIGQKADLSIWKGLKPENALNEMIQKQKPDTVLIDGITVLE